MDPEFHCQPGHLAARGTPKVRQPKAQEIFVALHQPLTMPYCWSRRTTVTNRWYEKAQLLAPAVAAHYGGRTDDDGGHSLISAIQQGNLALFHVHGDRDGHIDCEKAIHALSSRIDSKNYRAFRIPGAGHSVMYDAPQQLIDCILDLTNAHAQLSR